MKDFVQKCELCGEIISDYRNSAWPAEQGPPKGFDEGNVYVSVGNPVMYFADDPEYPLPKDLEIKNCVKLT
jgi:hypothetical protein